MITLTIPDTVNGFTIGDLRDLPDKLRWELHNGRLVIMSPARLWHQEMEAHIRNLLQAAGRFAATEVGVINTPGDTRVPDVAAFIAEPIATDKRNAMVTMYRLERRGDDAAYVATARAALADLERDGLPRG